MREFLSQDCGPSTSWCPLGRLAAGGGPGWARLSWCGLRPPAPPHGLKCGRCKSGSSVVVWVKTTGTTPTALARGSSSRSRESISVVTFPRVTCRRCGSGLGSSVVVRATPQARVCTACLGDSSCRGWIRQYRTRPAGDSGGMVVPDRWAANTEPVVQRVVQSCCAAPTPRRS